MLKIAIVDDEPAMQEKLAAYVKKYTVQNGTLFHVDVFSDGDEILENYHSDYDVIFLDVEMPHLDGMEAARRIRAQDEKTILVFITNNARYAIHGYSVGAMDYILKPVSYFAFSQQIEKAIRKIKQQQGYDLTISSDGIIRRIDVASIYYLESDRHHVKFFLDGDDFTISSSLREMEEKLAGRHFARSSNSFLVNLSKVSGVFQDCVAVGPYKLPLSRTYRKSFLDALASYIDR